MRSAAWFELQDPLREHHLAVRRREVPSWSIVHSRSRGERDRFLEEARGWPALALRSEVMISSYSYGNPTARARDAIVLRVVQEGRWGGLLLPLRPIWSGFLIDTAFFGSIAFAVLFGPGMARRAARRSRGQCLRCGYDMRAIASATCPECGALQPRGEGADG